MCDKKQRNSVVSTHFADRDSDEDDTESNSERNVRFEANSLTNSGVTNEAFDGEQEVVLRKKAPDSNNSFENNGSNWGFDKELLDE